MRYETFMLQMFCREFFRLVDALPYKVSDGTQTLFRIVAIGRKRINSQSFKINVFLCELNARIGVRQLFDSTEWFCLFNIC